MSSTWYFDEDLSFDEEKDEYNEDKALKFYVIKSVKFFLTQDEHDARELAVLRKTIENGVRPGTKEKLEEHYQELFSEASPKVRELSFQVDLNKPSCDLFLKKHQNGEMRINRCPKCTRIVRTSLAKQCLWCGHAWHNAEG